MKSTSSRLVICFSVVFLFSIAYSYPAGPVQSPNYYSKPGNSPQYASNSDKDAQVLSYAFDFNPEDSSFQYGFETSNGLSAQARGYQKGDIQAIEGQYTQPDAEGKPSIVTYTADENGYQPKGDAIPTVPPLIAKAVAYLLSLPSTESPPTYPQTNPQYTRQYNPQYQPQNYAPRPKSF